MDEGTLHVLRLSKDHVCVEVDVNAVPLEIRMDGRFVTKSEQINPWLKPGENTLRVRVDSPNGGTTLEGMCEVRVEAGTLGGGARSLGTGAIFIWPAHEMPSKPPVERITTFSSPNAPRTDFWENAKEFELDRPASEAIVGLLSEVQSALIDRDLQKLANLLDYKARDIGRAQHMSETEARESQLRFLKHVTQAPKWKVKPIELRNSQMHVIAKNRLVWVTRTQYEPLFQSESGFELPVYVAPVRGKWTIVR